MNKQTIIKNILTIYGKYGVTQEDIEPLIDGSVKDCLIFTFFDVVNYPVKKDTFVEISYEELLDWCEEIEMVYCVKSDKMNE